VQTDLMRLRAASIPLSPPPTMTCLPTGMSLYDAPGRTVFGSTRGYLAPCEFAEDDNSGSGSVLMSTHKMVMVLVFMLVLVMALVLVLVIVMYCEWCWWWWWRWQRRQNVARMWPKKEEKSKLLIQT
jgi:hypothetical protein